MSVYVLARSVKISSGQRRPKKCRNGGNSKHDLAHVRQNPGVRAAFFRLSSRSYSAPVLLVVLLRYSAPVLRRAITSTSTGASKGRSETPTAERAWAVPKTSPKRSDAPLITPGWPPNPGADATKPVTFTIDTESMSTRELMAAKALSAAWRA